MAENTLHPLAGKNIGLLGAGNMGGAVLRGLLQSGLCKPSQLFAADPHPAALSALQALGVTAVSDAKALAECCDILVLAVKPQVWGSLVPLLSSGSPTASRLAISVMAGISSASLKASLPSSWRIIRTMPNLPLSVGEGATGIEWDGVNDVDGAIAEAIFGACGKGVRVSAAQMDAVTGLSGSGPMYAFEFLEGLIQGGVKAGLPRDTAVTLAKQTVRGALALLESSQEHPSAWTAKVCSPGGTTIHALHTLEKGGLKGLLTAAVEAATARSKELSKL